MIPKRAVGALITTVLALILLFNFKTPDDLTAGGVATGGTVAVGDAPASTSGTGSTTGSTAAVAATPAPTTESDTGTSTDDATTAATAAGAYKDGTATGAVISTRFGDVQVQVTISGGAIADVTALQLPDRDRRSQSIASAAAPILRQEALTAQSASIDLLSGATYTSEAYAESLQSALDQVRA
jgi:uncharacterized protein with FMN-binding domain